MATLRLITEQDFRTSRYAQVEDQLDGNLSDVIAQAEDYIERVLDRRLDDASYTEIIRPTGSILFLANRPIVSLTSVDRRASRLDAWESLDLAAFEIMSARAAGDLGTVRDLDEQCAGYQVKVVYTAGFATMPPSIVAAVILQTVIYAYQDFAVYVGGGDGKKDDVFDLQEQVMDYIKPFMKGQLR